MPGLACTVGVSVVPSFAFQVKGGSWGSGASWPLVLRWCRGGNTSSLEREKIRVQSVGQVKGAFAAHWWFLGLVLQHMFCNLLGYVPSGSEWWCCTYRAYTCREGVCDKLEWRPSDAVAVGSTRGNAATCGGQA